MSTENTKMNTMEQQKNYFEEIGAWPIGSKKIEIAYVTGFFLSFILTITAYVLAVNHVLSLSALLPVVVTLACVQFIVQMACFLHLGREAGSRDKLTVLAFSIIINFILVAGSLWIMDNLNYRMMPNEQQMNQYMDSQKGI